MSDDITPNKAPAVRRGDHANDNFSDASRSSDNLRLSTLRRIDWPKAGKPDDDPPPQAA